MTGFCDLHSHSRASDGSLTPTELFHLGEHTGLEALALTDHNTVEGLPEFLAAGQGRRLTPIPGIELSADWQELELHIVALFLKPQDYDPIRRTLAQVLEWKEDSNHLLTQRLQQAGIPIDYARVCARTEGVPNRAHFAAELTAMGVTGSIQEAIDTLLSPHRGYYVAPPHADALQILSLIRQLGAVSVLAHPFYTMDPQRVRLFLSQARELDAMETRYPSFTPQQQQIAQDLAEEFHLLPSGGSDFHGAQKPDIRLGQVPVPMAFLDALARRAQ